MQWTKIKERKIYVVVFVLVHIIAYTMFSSQSIDWVLLHKLANYKHDYYLELIIPLIKLTREVFGTQSLMCNNLCIFL